MRASRNRLADGRWHFQHGPIDLIIGAQGDAVSVSQAINGSWNLFQSVLDELVAELRALRRRVDECVVNGAIARRMVSACAPFAPRFITPMAAVSGAVADEMITTLSVPGVTRAYVNNGGDIALHLSRDTSFCVGLCVDTAGKPWKVAALDGALTIGHASPVRGIATSGWRGRSFSLGIADSVTVLAATAAQADAAATLVANAVNVESAAVTRAPANTLKDDTDLGERLVTVDVGALTPGEVTRALESGASAARGMMAAGLIHAAVLALNQQVRTVAQDTTLTPLDYAR